MTCAEDLPVIFSCGRSRYLSDNRRMTGNLDALYLFRVGLPEDEIDC
jgi:hypothetical protein